MTRSRASNSALKLTLDSNCTRILSAAFPLFKNANQLVDRAAPSDLITVTALGDKVKLYKFSPAFLAADLNTLSGYFRKLSPTALTESYPFRQALVDHLNDLMTTDPHEVGWEYRLASFLTPVVLPPLRPYGFLLSENAVDHIENVISLLPEFYLSRFRGFASRLRDPAWTPSTDDFAKLIWLSNPEQRATFARILNTEPKVINREVLVNFAIATLPDYSEAQPVKKSRARNRPAVNLRTDLGEQAKKIAASGKSSANIKGTDGRNYVVEVNAGNEPVVMRKHIRVFRSEDSDFVKGAPGDLIEAFDVDL